jgi:DNA glycosylase AlkZ-like
VTLVGSPAFGRVPRVARSDERYETALRVSLFPGASLRFKWRSEYNPAPMTSQTLTAAQINRATLARQMLLSREKTTVVKAVERLVAMQAQVARPPFVGLWTRAEGFRREDLLTALRKKQIVRGTSLRGTIHMMTAADFIGLRGAIQPALTLAVQGILKDRFEALDLAALDADGRRFFEKPATFDALRDHLKKKYPDGDERAMAYTIRTHLPLVQVPTDDPWAFPSSADFTLAETWLGKKISTLHAPAHTLVKRYLAAFGPATVRDAQVWCGVPNLADVFESVRPNLVTFRCGRRELFDLPDAPRPPDDTPVPIRFLPEFDNLVLSHEDRTRVLPDEHRSRVLSKNLQVRATFLVNGIVSGAWKTERRKKSATLLLEPFEKLSKKTIGELETEGEALLRFIEETAETREIKWAR